MREWQQKMLFVMPIPYGLCLFARLKGRQKMGGEGTIVNNISDKSICDGRDRK